MNQPKRGDLVICRAFGNEPLVRRLWHLSAAGAFILNEEEYSKRMAGHSSLGEVGFPIRDCFLYNTHNEHVIKHDGVIDWGQLTPLQPILHT